MLQISKFEIQLNLALLLNIYTVSAPSLLTIDNTGSTKALNRTPEKLVLDGVGSENDKLAQVEIYTILCCTRVAHTNQQVHMFLYVYFNYT